MKCLLNDIYDRPGLLNNLNRKQKLLVFDQLMDTADLYHARRRRNEAAQGAPDFDLIDHPTVDQWLARHGVPCPPSCPCKCH
jgi:hypothetical protein